MILESGDHEDVKAVTHAALGLLTAVCLTYNALAWCYRRERHLAVNTLMYGTLLWIEVQQVRHHWTAWTRRPPP